MSREKKKRGKYQKLVQKKLKRFIILSLNSTRYNTSIKKKLNVNRDFYFFKENDNFRYLEISNQSLAQGVNFCKNSLAKGGERHNLEYFYLDLIDSKICTTDGKKLQTSKIEILEEKNFQETEVDYYGS